MCVGGRVWGVAVYQRVSRGWGDMLHKNTNYKATHDVEACGNLALNIAYNN